MRRLVSTSRLAGRRLPRGAQAAAARVLLFSSSTGGEDKKNADFQETLKRVQSEAEARSKEAAGEDPSPSSSSSFSSSSGGVDVMGRLREWYEYLDDNVRAAYQEMSGQSKSSVLHRTVQQADSFKRPKQQKAAGDEGGQGEREGEDGEAAEAEAAPTGPSAIVLVKEPTSQWERMKQRLEGSQVIREMLRNAKKFQSAAADTDIGKQAARVGQSFREKLEDAREFYETSQSPMVYKVAGLISDLTAATEEGNATTAILKLDPAFNKEEWADEVKRNLVPTIIRAHLSGDPKVLKPWLGEGVYKKLSEDIRIRKSEGVTIDPHILELDENQILMSFHDNEPIIVVSYAVQQINCIRKKGEIVEGRADAIVMKFYSLAFQQAYDEDDGSVKWRIIDYQFGGETPYL